MPARPRRSLAAAPLAALALVAAACRASPPPPAAIPEEGARPVMVESQPPGAEVAVGGRSRCQTPCTIRLAPGRHRLSLKMSGYLPWEQDLVVRLDADEKVSASLVSSH
jgi:hypothetical protein